MGQAFTLNAMTWNLDFDGICAVSQSTVATVLRHFSDRRRRDSGMLRNRITLTTVSSSMLAETSTRITMRSPPSLSPLRYWRSPEPTKPFTRLPGLPSAGVPAGRRLRSSSICLEVRLELLDRLAAGNGGLVGVGELFREPLGLVEHAVGEPLGAFRVGLGRCRLLRSTTRSA